MVNDPEERKRKDIDRNKLKGMWEYRLNMGKWAESPVSTRAYPFESLQFSDLAIPL